MALTTDSSVLTAYANDYDFDGVFARQVQALGRPGDGDYATGNTGSLPTMADVAICVPGTETQHLQETHLAIEHLICHIVEREVFGSGH